MKLTIGIPAHNEEKNISNLLKFVISEIEAIPYPSEIIVVNDGSTDNTEKIIREYESKVKLVTKEQGGKVSAINEVIKKSISDIIIIQDSDTITKQGSYFLLINQFLNKSIGMVAGRGIPTNQGSSFSTYAAKTHAEMHHLHSLRMIKNNKSPRIYGALYAFRKNLVDYLPEKIIADGEYVCSIVKSKNYSVVYEPDALFYTLEAKNLFNLIKTRRRRIIGHLYHKKVTDQYVSSTKITNSASLITDYLKVKRLKVKWFKFSFLIMLEVLVRLLAYYDFKLDRIPYIYRS